MSAAEKSRSDASRRRVLIADDDALIRRDLAEMLVEEGFEVVGEAGDGARAASLALELRPDLVILDVKMPVKDGIAAATEIAEQQIAPVIILTAYSERELIQRAIDAGAMTYLAKPFSNATLLPAIELAAARYAEVVALRADIADANERLEARKVIDRAKGVLMDGEGMKEAEAFSHIQRRAMSERRKMRDVAQEIIEA